MTALLDLDANIALEHALALVDEAAEALAQIPLEAVVGVGLGDQLVRLRTVQRRLDATGSAIGQRFASSSEWDMDGARSAARWIYGNGNDSWAQSRSVIERGSLATAFPRMAQAWRDGEVSAQHIDALGRILRRYVTLRAGLLAVDDAITEIARRCEPMEFYQQVRALCHRVDPEAVDQRDRDRGTGLHVSTLMDGFVRVDGTLDPVLGARFAAALESARRAVDVPEGEGGSRHADRPRDAASDGTADPLSAEALGESAVRGRDPRPLSQRNLDALSRILDAAGAATDDLALPLVSGERPTVNVTVPLDALIDESSVEVGWLERFGVPTTMITGASARALACDASLRPLVVDRQGQLVAMLPKVRAIHPALRRAVFMRDHHCRFPGCRSRIDEVHHIVFHSRGGPTVLANLIGLCWYHHHVVHDAGWLLEGDPGGRMTFRSRYGRESTSDPPGYAQP